MVTAKVTRYKRQGRKRTQTLFYRKKVRNAIQHLCQGVLLCNTEAAVDAAAALAKVINHQGLNNQNYLLFLVLLETNNQFVIDALIGERNPFLLFSAIKPNWFLIKETFRILAKYKANELCEKALLALLGVVQNTYKTSKYGYRLYPLTTSDVYNLGKYLDKSKGQQEERNRLLLEILFDLYFVGVDADNRNSVQVGIKANEIRMCFFDNMKKMADAIPHVLLIHDFVRQAIEPKNFRIQGADVESQDGRSRAGPPAAAPKRNKRA